MVPYQFLVVVGLSKTDQAAKDRREAIHLTECPARAGVGATGAASLLRKYGSLEAALVDGRFAKQADELRLFRSIATMDRKAPLPSLRNQKPTWSKAAALARDWKLTQLAKRLEELASS